MGIDPEAVAIKFIVQLLTRHVQYGRIHFVNDKRAEVVELADTRCSGRRRLYACVGSNPTFGTTFYDALPSRESIFYLTRREDRFSGKKPCCISRSMVHV